MNCQMKAARTETRTSGFGRQANRAHKGQPKVIANHRRQHFEGSLTEPDTRCTNGIVVSLSPRPKTDLAGRPPCGQCLPLRDQSGYVAALPQTGPRRTPP